MREQSKGSSNSGQADNQGSKTGMGIDGPMRARALLIAVGRCSHSSWSLPVATRDAKKLRETLADPGICGYPPEQIQVLSDESATRAGIVAALDDLVDADAADPDATTLVYYSGHGWRHVDSEGVEQFFLIPYDVRPEDLMSSALRAEDFIQRLGRLNSRRVLVMVDTCHASGMAKDSPEIPEGFAAKPLSLELVETIAASKELGVGRGRAVFLSCRAEEKSWILPGDNSLSIFTQEALACLNGAGSRPEDRVVTLAGLMNHLGKAVPASAQEIGHKQTPVFRLDTEDFPIALIRGGRGLELNEPRQQLRDPDEGGRAATVSVNSAVGRNVVTSARIDKLNMG